MRPDPFQLLQSHVRNFYDDYSLKVGEKKYYWHGPDWEWTGYDCRKIFARVVDALMPILKANPDEEIVLIGHSRGGYVAIELVRHLQSLGYRVKFLGMYDAVDSAPGFGDAETIPSNVDVAAHAVGNPHVLSREFFNTADHGPEEIHAMERYVEKEFYATHAGIGGAPWTGDHPTQCINRQIDELESVRVDLWMRTEALGAGVRLKNAGSVREANWVANETLHELYRQKVANEEAAHKELERELRTEPYRSKL